MPKLSDTQAVLLATAAARSDLSVLPPPETLTLKGAALERTLSALIRRGLIAEAAVERRARKSKWVVEEDDPRKRQRLVITPAVDIELDGEVRLCLSESNSGKRPGDRGRGLYAADTATDVTLPARQLAQSPALSLELGASRTVSMSSLPDDVGYRGPTACKAAGITYRQLDYWARTGLVEPSVRGAAARAPSGSTGSATSSCSRSSSGCSTPASRCSRSAARSQCCAPAASTTWPRSP